MICGAQRGDSEVQAYTQGLLLRQRQVMRKEILESKLVGAQAWRNFLSFSLRW